MKVLSFGEILWDVYPDGKYIGGAPLNFAAHLAKHEHDVYMLSSLGDDELGREAITQLEKWNVSTSLITSSSTHNTGTCLVTLDDKYVPSYNLLNDVAYDYIKTDGVDNTFDVLYFGTLALRSSTNYNSLKQLISKNSFSQIFVDINIRPPFFSKETVEFAVKNATIIKVSLEEMPNVSSLILNDTNISHIDFSRKLTRLCPNLNCIIITLGDKGAYAYDCINSVDYSCDSENVVVKSTVGAGDSFSAAFLSKYLNSSTINECLKYASLIAGFVVSNNAAVPDYNIEDFSKPNLDKAL